MGGTGGTGGGGAGGTVELYGSAVYAGSATVNTSSGDMTVGFDGQLLIGSNTPISMPTEQGVGNVYSTTGPTTTNPFISGSQNSTPLIAGLSGGAESFGLIPTGGTLYNELTASGGALSSAIASAPANALVAVLRESIPTSYQDQYSGYDLVLYVNLTNMNLAGPELGVTQGSVNTNFEPALEYDSLANATGQQTIQAIPADSIFAILVPRPIRPAASTSTPLSADRPATSRANRWSPVVPTTSPSPRRPTSDRICPACKPSPSVPTASAPTP